MFASPPSTRLRVGFTTNPRLPRWETRNFNGKPTLMYSLDVLRLDSINSSLKHLSSSMTFAKEPGNSQSERNLHDDFHSASQIATSTSSPTRAVCCREQSTPPQGSPFPHSTAFVMMVDNNQYSSKHRINSIRVSEQEFRRRKHICPICSMRFKRPSGLNTHLNSHTGATRESYQVF